MASTMSRWSGRRMLNRMCRKRLGISRREFLRRLDRGDYDGTDCGTKTGDAIIWLSMLAPFGR